MRPYDVFFLLLFLFFVGVDGASYPSLDPGMYCDFGSSAPLYSLNFFQSTFYPVQPVTVDGTYLIAMYPPLLTASYHVESVRSLSVSIPCSVCPYDDPIDGISGRMAYGIGGVPYDPSPMYGPCLDNARSKKTACVQNTLLFPPTFVGEYFYYDQYTIPAYSASTPNANNFSEHVYLYNDVLGTKAPTNFGLGMGRVKAQLALVQIVNKNDSSVNTQLTDQFKANYTTVSPQGWLLWGQHYCTPGCHRNAQYQQVQVRDSDWVNQSAVLQYLNRRDSGSAPGTPLLLIRCQVCPAYHAAYRWSSAMDAPSSETLQWNVIAPNCFPWFGAIPVLDSSGLNFKLNYTLNHGAADGVVLPTSNDYQQATPCPVNTYNDVCAHTYRYASSANSVKPQCKPCPAGTHTDGQIGAWFCLPAAGLIFSAGTRSSLLDAFDARVNQSIAWSRRSKIGYEFECGYLADHCKQCKLMGLTNMLPDAFNQQMILGPLLATQPCPEGMYCPHAFRVEPIACPASKPWSPAGSSVLANCTCAKGTYLNELNQCQACPDPSSCPFGKFLSDWTYCTTQNGPKKHPTCTECLNVPSHGNATGTGIEYVYYNGGTTVIGGACPFKCQYGYVLTQTGKVASNPCANPWACVAVPPYTNAYGQLIYADGLRSLQDGLTTTGGSCAQSVALSSAMDTFSKDSGLHQLVSSSCLSTTCTAQAPCRVSKDATYYSNVECTPCTGTLPLNAFYSDVHQSTALSARARMCAIQCSSTTMYLNRTANACMSCENLTKAVCPPSYQVMGGGCGGNSSVDFPQSMQSMTAGEWCVNCLLAPPAPDSGYYLRLLSPCSIEACLLRDMLNNADMYYKTPCTGTSAGELVSCTRSNACNSSTEFLYGDCTKYETPTCRPCTSNKPGFYLSAACTHVTQDAVWSTCPVGFTCDGSPQPPQPCPYPQTSFAGSQFACMCPPGMLPDDTGACVYQTCADLIPPARLETSDIANYGSPSPGNPGLSSRYMELSTETKKSVCSQCPGGSVTYDAHPLGLTACRCPFNSYLTNGVCTACSQNVNVCPGCWRGNAQCTSATPLAPFLVSETSCMSGFDHYDTATGSRTGTGSAVYVTDAGYRAGWTLFFDLGVSTITQMATTSTQNEVRTVHLNTTKHNHVLFCV